MLLLWAHTYISNCPIRHIHLDVSKGASWCAPELVLCGNCKLCANWTCKCLQNLDISSLVSSLSTSMFSVSKVTLIISFFLYFMGDMMGILFSSSRPDESPEHSLFLTTCLLIYCQHSSQNHQHLAPRLLRWPPDSLSLSLCVISIDSVPSSQKIF